MSLLSISYFFTTETCSDFRFTLYTEYRCSMHFYDLSIKYLLAQCVIFYDIFSHVHAFVCVEGSEENPYMHGIYIERFW